jgi:hypothetical protein
MPIGFVEVATTKPFLRHLSRLNGDVDQPKQTWRTSPSSVVAKFAEATRCLCPTPELTTDPDASHRRNVRKRQ